MCSKNSQSSTAKTRIMFPKSWVWLIRRNLELYAIYKTSSENKVFGLYSEIYSVTRTFCRSLPNRVFILSCFSIWVSWGCTSWVPWLKKRISCVPRWLLHLNLLRPVLSLPRVTSCIPRLIRKCQLPSKVSVSGVTIVSPVVNCTRMSRIGIGDGLAKCPKIWSFHSVLLHGMLYTSTLTHTELSNEIDNARG
jgi:hypothetical protein